MKRTLIVSAIVLILGIAIAYAQGPGWWGMGPGMMGGYGMGPGMMWGGGPGMDRSIRSSNINSPRSP